MHSKTVEPIPILRELRGQQFERHLAAKPRIFGKVNLAHPAGAELFDNPITRNGFFHSGVAGYPNLLN